MTRDPEVVAAAAKQQAELHGMRRPSAVISFQCLCLAVQEQGERERRVEDVWHRRLGMECTCLHRDL